MLSILNRLEWLVLRNRSYEAKRLVKQEIENVKEITEKNCKRYKLNKTYCLICSNLNCNNNKNKISNMKKGVE